MRCSPQASGETLLRSLNFNEKKQSTPKVNETRMVNEYFFSALTFLMLTFTEFVETNKARHQMGMVYVYVLIAYMLFNLLIIFKSLLKSLYLMKLKYQNKFCKKKVGDIIWSQNNRLRNSYMVRWNLKRKWKNEKEKKDED